MVPRVRRTGAILYLAFLAFIAFTLGDTFKEAMIVIAVLGWITVAVLAVYMVLFRNMKFTLFKDEPLPGSDVVEFDDVDRVVVATDELTGDRTVVVEKS